MEVQSCSKEIGAGAALENCRRLINQINTWLSAEEPFVNVRTTRRQISLTAPRVRALCSSSKLWVLAMLCTWLCIGAVCAGTFAGGFLVLLMARLP
jgi:hypothetical protein